MPGPCFPMPFGEIAVCGGEFVGGAFAALVWREGVGVETRWHFDMEYGCGTGSAAQACSGWAGTGGWAESAGHLQMAVRKNSCAGFLKDLKTHEACGGAAAMDCRAWGEVLLCYLTQLLLLPLQMLGLVVDV